MHLNKSSNRLRIAWSLLGARQIHILKNGAKYLRMKVEKLKELEQDPSVYWSSPLGRKIAALHVIVHSKPSWSEPLL